MKVNGKPQTPGLLTGPQTSSVRLLWRAFGIWLLLLAAGCATSSPAPPCAAAQTAISELLYFGLGTESRDISGETWEAFVAEAVTPRFPQGFTVWAATGQWRDARGKVQREPSRVLNIVHAPDAAADQAIAAIIGDFRQRFRQEAVLKTRSEVCASY
jgi:hypothetical protein